VNCAVVDLFLAVDGNPSHLYALAKGVSNSGSYDLTVPPDAPLADRAFLILKSDNNIFLAVYPFALQIIAP
jgi:hypothetical protein